MIIFFWKMFTVNQNTSSFIITLLRFHLLVGLLFLVLMNGNDLQLLSAQASLPLLPFPSKDLNEKDFIFLDVPVDDRFDRESCLKGIGNLSEHFTCAEARFYKGATFEMVDNARALASQLEVVRKEAGPIRINSWCRSPLQNKRVGGVKFSTHLTCSGVDVKVDSTVKFRRLLQNKTTLSIGYYASHTHVDLRYDVTFTGSYALGM